MKYTTEKVKIDDLNVGDLIIETIYMGKSRTIERIRRYKSYDDLYNPEFAGQIFNRIIEPEANLLRLGT